MATDVSSDISMSMSGATMDGPLQSVDTVSSAESASNFSALSQADVSYGDYYSPPGLEDQKQSIPGQEGDGNTQSRSACNPCKKNHTKCSGELPVCVQCTRRKIQCSYSPQKKRGPKTGQVKSLQEEVKQLNDVVEQQRKQLEALQLQSAADDARKRRRDQTITIPDPEVRADLAMPAFVAEYIRLFEEHVEPGCVLRDPTQSRTSLDNVRVLLQYSPADSDPFRARQLLGMYTMLASGAQVFGNPVHAQEFIQRARGAAQLLFDISDLQVAAGFDRITFYFVGVGDLDKARIYNGVALRMIENLDVPLSHPVHLSILLARGLLVKTVEERVDIAQRLRTSGTIYGEMLGLTLVMKVKLHLFRTGVALRLDEMLPVIARTDEIIKQRALPERRQLTTKAMVKGLKAGIFYAVGQLPQAEQFADAATRLAKQLGTSGQYTSFCAAVGVEWAAEVHHHRGKLDALREDCSILEAIAARFPIMTEVSRRYNTLLAALTQVPTEAAASMQLPVSVEMLAPPEISFPPPEMLGDITKMGGSEGSLERLLQATEPIAVLDAVGSM